MFYDEDEGMKLNHSVLTQIKQYHGNQWNFLYIQESESSVQPHMPVVQGSFAGGE